MPNQKIAFYLRVSTISQDYPSQLHALKEFCRRQNWAVPVRQKKFSEKITGKIARRTQLDRLLQACRDGHVDTILVYKLDRLGNSFQHLVNLIAELDKLKIRVIGVSDNIDTSTNDAATHFFRNTLLTGAQFNREIISERTRAGIEAARAAGRHPGRRRTNDARIAKAVKLRAAGKTISEIQKATKLSRGYLSDIFNKHRPASASDVRKTDPHKNAAGA